MLRLKLWLTGLGVFVAATLWAQRNEIYSERIASLQVMANGNWMAQPVIVLNTNAQIRISFDDLTHEYHRYVYRIEHCEADWSMSEDLFTGDYIYGFNSGQPIDDVEESLNTNVLYTHYNLNIPNEQCQVKMSGNYRVTVYEENDDEAVFSVCFMVVEPLMGVSMGVTTNTDLGINTAFQQIEMQVSYGGLTVTDPERQLKTVVLQNARWDNAVYNPAPQFVMSDGLRWSHCRDLIFPGGNEYRKFEILDETHTTMGVEAVDWDGERYHAYLWPDEPRLSYVYDEDANGSFLIRNSDNVECDRTCEYVWVHFSLPSWPLSERVFINANWTHDQFLPSYELEYNDESHSYEAVLPLKQGYYSYQYLLLNSDGTTTMLPAEGSFYQTENQYSALVYYRGVGERTDRLVGYGSVSTR